MDKIIVFITWASRWLWKGLVEHFVKKWYWVFATARSFEDRKLSESLYEFPLDIRNYDEIEKSFWKCIEVFWKIDVLISNASWYLSWKWISDTSNDEIIDNVISTFTSWILLSKKFVSLNMQGWRWKIFFISSSASKDWVFGCENSSVYSWCKAWINRYSQTLNQEISNYWMSSTVVIPHSLGDEWEKWVSTSYYNIAEVINSLIIQNVKISRLDVESD